MAKLDETALRAIRWHAFYRGKVQTLPKVPVRGAGDFAVWYTPGVAAPCLEIARQPEAVWDHTNRGNTIAIVSDGTRVLGLGNIGPAAGLPVMEGKALLFKILGGVDAVPLCVAPRSEDELVALVRMIEPSFGGVNLEDISQPKCFRVLDACRAHAGIPVWHDDQQGTATVVLAAVENSLRVVGKELRRARIAIIGAGAAGLATLRLLASSGADAEAIIVCDTHGTLHRGRADIEAQSVEYGEKWRVCTTTNADGVAGGIAEAMRGADVCIGFARPGPGVILPEQVRSMARDAIVFACANPVPEIWPAEAREAGARIVASGRSDLPNQVNNSLAFPGIFRGVLDVRARAITDGMARAAAQALAALAPLDESHVLPSMTDPRVAVEEAVAVGLAAQREGVAVLSRTAEELRASATNAIASAVATLDDLVRAGRIPAPP